MRHRHLNHEEYTLAAIDDVIERGGRSDWGEMRRAAEADPEIIKKIQRICSARTEDPYAQRYYLWKHYAKRKLA